MNGSGPGGRFRGSSRVSAGRTLPAAALLASILAAPVFASGAGSPPPPTEPGKTRQLRVLASFLPIYVFAIHVAGEVPGVSVETMLPPELGCPHGYALSPGDLRRIAAADLFLANGHGMETFLGPPVREANPGITLVETAAGISPILSAGGRRGTA